MGLGSGSACPERLLSEGAGARVAIIRTGSGANVRTAERPVPRWARVLVLRYLAKLLCVRARKPKTIYRPYCLAWTPVDCGGPLF